MQTEDKTTITVEKSVNVSIRKAWEVWTNPEHITQWNNASNDWFKPCAENDLRVGGNFLYRMEARDGSFGFDFSGVYDEVKPQELIAYTLGDGRKVKVTFINKENQTLVTESFEAEETNSIELQRVG